MSTVTAVPLQPVRRRVLVYLWIGIALAVLVAIALSEKGTGEQRAIKGSNEAYLAWHRSQAGIVETKSGLQYQVIKPGEGPLPTATDVAGVMYVGTLRDGTVFDESPQPVPFPLTEGTAIPGFTEALKLMPKGAHFKFWMKPELAYKEASPSPKIPPNSMLIFDVSMLGFLPEATYRQMQMQQMMQQQRGAPAGGPSGAGPQGER
ncbi:hypothetical protein BH10PSE14_BH10PSE14_30380 [soil metagenome]